MEIVLLTTETADLSSWSGTIYYIKSYLSKEHRVSEVGPDVYTQAALYSMSNLRREASDVRYINILSSICSERVSAKSPDLVFFCDLALSLCPPKNIPMIHFSDASYATLPRGITRNSKEEQFQIESYEKKALLQYDSIIYASEWAADITSTYYNLARNKIHIVEFGANIPHPEHYQIDMAMNLCQLVFIGRNWEAKGGDIAFKAYKLLQERGIPTQITFIGCTPPEEVCRDEGTRIYPFLDKSNPDELQQFCDILYHSHFLLLPTRFDAFGIAFAEASAYGVPSIGTRVGGTSQAVREGKNGYLLPLEAEAEEYAEKIIELWSNPEQYRALRQSSRKEYETRLNWGVWLERVDKIFEETIAEYKKKNGNGAI